MSQLIEYWKQFGRFQRNARLYLLSNALSGITFGIIVVLYNLYLTALGYGTDFIGLVLFVGTLGAGLAIFPAGICIDRFSGKGILIWSSVLIGIVGMGQILFRTPVPLLISTFIAGIAGAFVLVINAPFLTLHSTPAERPHLFSLNIVVTLATSVIGEALGGILPIWLRTIPWLMGPLPSSLAWMLADQAAPRAYQLALLLAGLIAAPNLIPLFLLSNDHPRRSAGDPASAPVLSQGSPSMGENQGRGVSLRPPPGRTQGDAPTLVPNVSPARMETLRQVPSLSEALASLTQWRRQLSLHRVLFSPVVAIVLVQVLIATGAGLFIPYFNIYFVRHLGASSALFGVIAGGANLLNALFALLAPWLAQRIGKVATMALTELVSVPLMLIIGLTRFLPLAALLYPFRQGFMDMSQGIMQVFSMEVVSRRHRGLANSSYQAAYQGASAIGTPIGGLIIAHVGYTPVFICAALLYMLAIGLLWARFGQSQLSVQTHDEQSPDEVAL